MYPSFSINVALLLLQLAAVVSRACLVSRYIFLFLFLSMLLKGLWFVDIPGVKVVWLLEAPALRRHPACKVNTYDSHLHKTNL